MKNRAGQMYALMAGITARAVEIDADGKESKKRIVEGYATTFDTPYELNSGEGWRFMEVVDRNAFKDCKMDDVAFQYNHEGRVLARTTNGTLLLDIDERGLHVMADIGGTESGRSLYDEIKGGYVNKMSIGFRIGATSETEERTKGEYGGVVYTSRITAFSLLADVSAVSTPANDNADIAARCAEYAKRSKEASAQSANGSNDERARCAEELALEMCLKSA